MPKVHLVKKARKDNPAVKAGESYYWWKFRYGGKRYSRAYPRPSQLTQSPFLSTVYAIEEGIGDSIDESAAQDIINELELLREECECSLDNMPDQFRDTSESGILLQERIDNLDQWIEEIECIDWESSTPEEAAVLISGSEPGF